MVKIGVIGCGKIAQTRHLPEYATNPHAKLVGYYDKIRERSVQMAELYGGKVYETYYDMINDPEIDAVSICVETATMPRSPTPPSMPASMSWWKSPWP